MKVEGYENIGSGDVSTEGGVSRREFLKAVGGGIFIFFFVCFVNSFIFSKTFRF